MKSRFKILALVLAATALLASGGCATTNTAGNDHAGKSLFGSGNELGMVKIKCRSHAEFTAGNDWGKSYLLEYNACMERHDYKKIDNDYGYIGNKTIQPVVLKTTEAKPPQQIIPASSIPSNTPVITPLSTPSGSAESKLEELHRMMRKGLITEDDYNKKKAEILRDM